MKIDSYPGSEKTYIPGTPFPEHQSRHAQNKPHSYRIGQRQW